MLHSFQFNICCILCGFVAVCAGTACDAASIQTEPPLLLVESMSHYFLCGFVAVCAGTACDTASMQTEPPLLLVTSMLHYFLCGFVAVCAGTACDAASMQTEPPPPASQRPGSARHLSYFDRLLLSSASRQAGQAASNLGGW